MYPMYTTLQYCFSAYTYLLRHLRTLYDGIKNICKYFCSNINTILFIEIVTIRLLALVFETHIYSKRCFNNYNF